MKAQKGSRAPGGGTDRERRNNSGTHGRRAPSASGLIRQWSSRSCSQTRRQDRLHPASPLSDRVQGAHRNGITSSEERAYGLVGGVAEGFCAAVELSAAEREELLQLCRQRLDALSMQRGEEVACLLTQKPAASGTGAATTRRSAAR